MKQLTRVSPRYNLTKTPICHVGRTEWQPEPAAARESQNMCRQ